MSNPPKIFIIDDDEAIPLNIERVSIVANRPVMLSISSPNPKIPNWHPAWELSIVSTTPHAHQIYCDGGVDGMDTQEWIIFDGQSGSHVILVSDDERQYWRVQSAQGITLSPVRNT